MHSKRTLSFWTAALPVLLLAGCTSGTNQSAQSTQDKKAELCTNLARFDTAVATLKSMSPSSTVGDFRAARQQVETTFSAVAASAASVQDAKTQDLQRAYEELDRTIKAVPDTATLNQALSSIAPQIAAVQTAENQVKAGLDCP